MAGVVRAKFASQMEEVDEVLSHFLDDSQDPAFHYALIRYHLGFCGEDLNPLSGKRLVRGKRLRAILCMLIGRAIGTPPGPLRTLMSASELLHSASLVHDDVQDGDHLRWGRPTIWSKWGSAQAINVGDAFIGLSFQQLLRLRDDGVSAELVVQVVHAYVQALVRMAEGQHLDIFYQGALDVGVDAYLDMIARKTGAALEGFAEATAIIGGSRQQARAAYRAFGRSFGVLYQVCDDIHAVWGVEEQTGKRSLNDLVTRKMTLPLIIGAQLGSRKLRSLLGQSAAQCPTFTADEAVFIAGELSSLGVRAMCLEHARFYRDAALENLHPMDSSSEEHRMLVAMVELCVDSATQQTEQTAHESSSGTQPAPEQQSSKTA